MKDKVIVVTGASSGIGAALATELVKRGAKGVILAARREPELRALAAKLGPTTRAVVADVSKRADNERLVTAAREAYGQLDVFVANAGRGISRDPSQLTDEDVDDMMTTNFKSVLYGIQAALPTFKAQQHGQILAVSSMLGRISLAAMRSAYSASKAAVNSLMASLRLELQTQYPNIHATTFLPGVVATDFGTSALHGGVDSGKIPTAISAEEAATVIAGAIETPVAELYSRPGMREMAAKYFSAEDVAQVERTFVPPGPR